jgi:hypothetical protein
MFSPGNPVDIYIILMILVLSSLPCLAASSAVLQVSATIRPWVEFKAVQHMYSYRITAADLRRGYVDLAGSISLEVRTNIPRDISIRFSSENGERILFRESAGGSFFENEYRLYPAHLSAMETIIRKIDSRIMLTANSIRSTCPCHPKSEPSAKKRQYLPCNVTTAVI